MEDLFGCFLLVFGFIIFLVIYALITALVFHQNP